jgi:hypothetical protein
VLVHLTTDRKIVIDDLVGDEGERSVLSKFPNRRMRLEVRPEFVSKLDRSRKICCLANAGSDNRHDEALGRKRSPHFPLGTQLSGSETGTVDSGADISADALSAGSLGASPSKSFIPRDIALAFGGSPRLFDPCSNRRN